MFHLLALKIKNTIETLSKINVSTHFLTLHSLEAYFTFIHLVLSKLFCKTEF